MTEIREFISSLYVDGGVVAGEKNKLILTRDDLIKLGDFDIEEFGDYHFENVIKSLIKRVDEGQREDL